jgi:hypothetical protein
VNRFRGHRRRLAALLAAGVGSIAALAVISAAAVATPSCGDDFTGPAGGSWATAANWTSATDPSAHAVPGSSTVVCLEGVGVVISSGAQAADSVQGQGGSLQITGGSLTLHSATDDSSVANFSLDDSGAFTAAAGQTVTVTGNLEWGSCVSCGAQLAINATIDQIAGSGGTVMIDGPGTGLSGPTLTGGSITSTSPVTIANGNFVADGGTSLTTTGTMTLGSGVQLDGDDPGATFSAAGLSITSGATSGFGPSNLVLSGGTTTIGPTSTLQAGAITLQAGTLDDNGGIQGAPGDSQSLTLNGGTLEGKGNIAGPVTNLAGTVIPGTAAAGSTLSMQGSYSQSAGGTLIIGLAGSTTADGLLQVSGAVTLGGDLVPSDAASFTPSAGEQWVVVLSQQSVTGTSTLSGADAGQYGVAYGARAVTLSAMSSTTTTTTTTTTTATTPTTGSTGTTTTAPGGGPAPVLQVPVDIVAPAISGKPLPGDALACSTGTWTNSPTSYAYLWNRAGVPIKGARRGTYVVQIADEGSGLTCTVTAANAAGPGLPSTSAPVISAQAGTLQCVRPRGKLGGTAVGPLALGFTRAQARRTLARYAVRGNGMDDFCLYGGWGIRAGYPSNGLLRGLGAAARRRVSGRIVLALTANPFYALDGVRPGTVLATVARRLRVSAGFRIGLNHWYLVPGTAARGVLKVRSGVIQEIGLADQRVIGAGRAAERRFLAGFTSA